MYQCSSSQALFCRAKFLPVALVLSSSSLPALPRFCRSYSNVNLSPGLHAYIPTVCSQSPLLPSLLPYACIFHDHLTCPNEDWLIFGSWSFSFVYSAETQTYVLLISLSGFHILLRQWGYFEFTVLQITECLQKEEKQRIHLSSPKSSWFCPILMHVPKS